SYAVYETITQRSPFARRQLAANYNRRRIRNFRAIRLLFKNVRLKSSFTFPNKLLELSHCTSPASHFYCFSAPVMASLTLFSLLFVGNNQLTFTQFHFIPVALR